MANRLSQSKTSQHGFGAIAYILLSIVLMAVVVGALATSGEDNVSMARVDESRSQLFAQANYIASAIRDCPATYGFNSGSGDFQGFPETSGGNVESGEPINDLVCPGNIGSGGNPQPLWQGDWFEPRGINGFTGWTYVKNTNGVSIGISLTGGAQAQQIYQRGVIGLTVNRFNTNEAEACDGNSVVANPNTAGAAKKFVLYLTRATMNPTHCGDH